MITTPIAIIITIISDMTHDLQLCLLPTSAISEGLALRWGSSKLGAASGCSYLSLFFLLLEELLVEPVRFRLTLESLELSLQPPGDTRSEELVLLMLQEGQADENEASIV